MGPPVPVARRTRSKGGVVWRGLMMSRKRRRQTVDGAASVEMICLESSSESEGGERACGASPSHSDAFMEMGFEFLGEEEDEHVEVVEINNDDADVQDEMHCEKKSFEVKVEVESEEGIGCSGFDVKNDGSGNWYDYDTSSSSMETEDSETSDEDFRVESEHSTSEVSDSSSSSDDDYYDVREGCSKMVKERVRKVDTETESSGVWRNNHVIDGVDLDEYEPKEHHLDSGTLLRAVSSLPKIQEMIGDSAEVVIEENKKGRKPKDGFTEKMRDDVDQSQTQPSASSRTAPLISNFKKAEPVEISESQKEVNLWKEMEMLLQNEGKKIADSTLVKRSERNNNVHDKEKDLRRVSCLPKTQKKIGISAKFVSNEDKKEKEHKDRGLEFFNKCFWGNQKDDDDEVDQGELKATDGDVNQAQTQPLAPREKVPLTWDTWKKKPIEKSESEKELDKLWAEMELGILAEEIGPRVQVSHTGTTETIEKEESNNQCKHDIIEDEQIGMICRWCGWIETDIKYMWPDFVKSERSGRRETYAEGNTSRFDEEMFKGSGDDTEVDTSQNEDTVWDLIPDVKQSLYPHQQEGFEFIWKNIAGTTDLAELKGVDPCNEGGCIISHVPGTGKTRLTMVFLQTYMQLFPKCLPVIIAPANILLIWEDELRKWNIGIPFHNLNNAELSGNEQAINEADWSSNQRKNKNTIRMVKLCSWYKEKSILLISYSLFEKLAGGKSDIDEREREKKGKLKKEKKRARNRKYIESLMGKVLHDYPGLLVLDEGHTPRNQHSCIWKVLSKSRAQKRVLLSGTPFQNNFLELYNILCLMKPSFPDSLPPELKKFCQSKLMQEKTASKDISLEPDSFENSADEKINQLKLLMNPFVHVHKGSILEKNLPGLRDCVLVLKPDGLQQETLKSIECSPKGLNYDHKLALVSVHPSLFLDCSLSEKDISFIDKDQFEKIRLNPYAGVKTKFLLEFVRLCDAVNEKVLVFSQFIDTLCLIKDQLMSALNWSVGKEVLYMYGRLDQKQKRALIHSFNDANSQAKVLLASIKASSEGINLIGASRVVLLDVVWNPSVERQAICRAYRLGQKKIVYTYHLLAQDTTECTKYCKQAAKNRLSELVFSNRNAEGDKLKSRGVIFEDRVLDIMVQCEDLRDMFGECLV